MAPNIPSAKITLSCPLFAADFDPRNNGFLLVGGGGGEGRSGVGNKIALLSTHRRDEISEVVDIELSRDEDSVTSLAASKSTDDSITALAGINSSQAEQKKGKNEHLRSFKVGYPPKKPTGTAAEEEGDREEKLKKAGEKTTPLGRASLFRPKYAKKTDIPETYQRLTRLSQWKGEGEPRIGAISTGLAPQGEIVLFDATVSSPQESDVVGRIRLGDGEEAEDVDMTLTGDSGEFTVGYTDGISLFTCNVSPTTRSNVAPDITSVYTVSPPGSKKKNKIRAVRFLSSTSAVLLQNLPDRGGCELVIVTADGKKPQWKATRRVRLHSKMKIGLGLDVCPLSASAIFERQYIIAVSGSDHSIATFTLEYIPRKGFSKFRPYATMRDVHPFTMTRITFSTFTPPKQPLSSDVGAQYVKLASVSVGNTVVVHTFPLSPIPPASVWARYVLVRPGPPEIVTTMFSTFMALLVVAFGAFFIQAFTEIRGGTPPYLGAKDWLSPRIRDMIANPYIFENGMPEKYSQPWPPTSTISSAAGEPTAQTLSQPLEEVLSGRLQSEESAEPTSAPGKLIIRAQGGTEILVQTQAPDEEVSEEKDSATKWEDLSDDLREAWRQRLVDAGHWAVDEGEAILEGLFFGGLAQGFNQG